MKTGKINCIIVDDEPVAREILESHLGKIDRICVVASCKNAVEAFKAIHSHPVELVFLDINMPDISGLSFAKSMSGNFKVIFTTAYREYAVDGFDLQAVDYLLKPISFERLLQGVNKFLEESASLVREQVADIHEVKEDFMFIRSDRKMVKVSFDEIVFIESLSDYVKIHCGDQKILVTRDTISNVETRLPHNDFLRVHRSYVVAISKIETFTSDTIGIGKYEIPISRSYRDGVLEKLGG
ncbi:MAG TPA: response regulator transcription factor [Bacteroides sp.]|nr:response regulator transcription factor [Bacteroides sp.]